MLSDSEIFAFVSSIHRDKPIEFIMNEYGKAKALNMQIEGQLKCGAGIGDKDDAGIGISFPLRKRYTERDLKVKPEEAITETSIKCCICGEERQTLTVRHLERHGVSVEEYRKLCGYDEERKLMSGRRERESAEIIKIAQKKRLEKRAEKRAEQSGISA